MIDADAVRARLRTMSLAEVSDDLLASAAYIPAAEAQVTKWLAAAGKQYAGLDADDQALAQALAVAVCARTVVAGAPTRKLKGGMVELSGADPGAVEVTVAELDAEIRRLAEALGIPFGVAEVTGAGGDGYEPWSYSMWPWSWLT